MVRIEITREAADQFEAALDEAAFVARDLSHHLCTEDAESSARMLALSETLLLLHHTIMIANN